MRRGSLTRSDRQYAIKRKVFQMMRFKNLFVMTIVLIALCASNAQSIGDSIGKSVDQLIDESRGIRVHDIYHPENPQESRMLWSLERGINFTMPGKVLGSGTSPGAPDFSAEISEEIQSQSASYTNAAQIPSPPESTALQGATSQAVASQAVASQVITSEAETSQGGSPQDANVAGNWSFRLRDSKNRVMALTLFQSNNALYGTGSINDGGDTLLVSASGSVEGDRLYLDAISSGTVTLYRIALTMGGNTASGEYRAFSKGEETWIGLAEGARIESG
jgi:hypothetical protein